MCSVTAHWEEPDNKKWVENKGWTCYPSCTVKDLRGDTLNLTHTICYSQQVTWSPGITMKSSKMKVKIRFICSGTWCCIIECVYVVLLSWPFEMAGTTHPVT